MPMRSIAVFLVLAACARTAPAPVPAARDDGRRAFDFHVGTWRTHVSRLAHPLTGSTTWVDYDGTTVVRPVWNGRANLVELVADGPAGHLELLSLRLFDPKAATWSLYSASARTGVIDPPVTGRFERGRGVFVGPDTLGGRPILVRFVISPIDATSWRFEQAFSADGGATWETNWIATDTRVSR